MTENFSMVHLHERFHGPILSCVFALSGTLVNTTNLDFALQNIFLGKSNLRRWNRTCKCTLREKYLGPTILHALIYGELLHGDFKFRFIAFSYFVAMRFVAFYYMFAMRFIAFSCCVFITLLQCVLLRFVAVGFYCVFACLRPCKPWLSIP